MAYYLKIDNKKRGMYLQMYYGYWDKEKKQARSKSIKAFGYLEDLVSRGIPNPIAFYKKYIKRLNEERTAASATKESRECAFSSPSEFYLGHFLLYTLMEELNVEETINVLSAQMRFHFSVYDMMSQLIFARVICPCSKSRTVSSIFPHLYGGSQISEDQVYDGLAFIGASYKKYIELFNHCYARHFKRDFSNVFFDCTNYFILRSTFHMTTNKRGHPKKADMIQ